MSAYQLLGCKLGTEVVSQISKSYFGIGCKSDLSLLQLFFYAASQPCDFNKCSLNTNIAKLIKHCANCRPIEYKHVILEENTDYTEWYNSQEYLDCLAVQLETTGCMQPMRQILASVNITITEDELCQAVLSSISITKEDCTAMSTVTLEHHCDKALNTIIMETLKCDNPGVTISGKKENN